MPSSRDASAHTPLRGLNTAAMIALLTLVGLATLIRGGNRHVAMLGLEWLAIAALLAMAWGQLMRGPDGINQHCDTQAANATHAFFNWAWWLVITAPLWLVAWAYLPEWMGWRSPSLNNATWSALILSLPLLACLAAGRCSSVVQAGTLSQAWIWVALLQVIWGILQVTGVESLLFGQTRGGNVAIGSFANRNTYSNFLAMALPLVVWRIATNRQMTRPQGRHRASPKRALSVHGWMWVVCLLLMLSLLFMTRSRTGIVTGLLVLALSFPLVLGQRAGRSGTVFAPSQRWALLGVSALVGLALLAAGWEWLARFDAEHLLKSNDGRALMREATVQAASAYWPWGSGLGSYATIFPGWHPAPLGSHLIDLAHNDYLQLLMELGLAFVLLLVVTLWLIGHQLRYWWRNPTPTHRADRNMRQLQVAAGLSLLAIGLHAWVDYPFHIPANAMMACFLLGVFLRPHEKHHTDQ